MQKNVVITGGSSGLGKAMIDKFNKTDYEFHIINIDLEENPHADQNIKIDLSKLGNIKAMSDLLPHKIDILINNCAVNYIDWFPEMDYEKYDELFNINVKAQVAMVKENLERLRDGTVLNIVSNAASVAMTNSLAYNGTKGAMKIITKQMARELSASHNMNVFSISPNKLGGTGMSDYIDQRVQDLRGWSLKKAQEIQVSGIYAKEETNTETLAEFIAFILSTKQRHKYLNGTDIPYGSPMGN